MQKNMENKMELEFSWELHELLRGRNTEVCLRYPIPYLSGTITLSIIPRQPADNPSFRVIFICLSI